MFSGFFVTVAMNPFDVVSTRMYNQKLGKTGVQYRNPFDCLYQTVKAEGLYGIYKGFLAHYLRLGPHTGAFSVACSYSVVLTRIVSPVLTMVFWEQLRQLYTRFVER